MEIKPSEVLIKALKILDKLLNGVSAREFGVLMWPDSKMHKKCLNQGNGATRGKAAWLSAGSYLSKLCKKELVRWEDRKYYITEKGRQILQNENKI